MSNRPTFKVDSPGVAQFTATPFTDFDGRRITGRVRNLTVTIDIDNAAPTRRQGTVTT